jgi:hypothetical protein
MKRLWRITLIAAATLAVITIALVAALWCWFWRNACDREEILLATATDGRTVVYKFEACTTIGTAVDTRVDLVSPSGNHKTIFRFSTAYGYAVATGPLEPSATWIPPHSLKISIGTVAAILEQRFEIEDVHVTYDIGTDLHEQRNWPK